jgi:triacylglycerol lipase
VETIVLAHGYPGFVKLGVIEYFNGVVEYLKKECQVEVLTPAVDPVGTIAQRSAQLLEQITEALPRKRVHIIAHSAGGLDARHLVSPQGHNRSDLVASLTTISTPHRGTPVADVALGLTEEFTDSDMADLLAKLSARDTKRHPSILEKLVAGSKEHADVLLQEVGIRSTDSAETVTGKLRATIRDASRFVRSLFFPLREAGLKDLTTSSVAQEFNPKIVDSTYVEYFSYAGVSGPREEDILPPILYIPYLIVLWREGENDGMVSVTSAQWGTFRGKIPADHAEEIGHDLSGISRIRRFITRQGFDHLRFYKHIVDELTKNGTNEA